MPGHKICKVYALNERHLEQIFKDFEEFEKVLKVRALRRHHYLRKIKRQ